ncbi:MAG: hypothetical protein R3A52_04045 [Polyangiales bacterium]
MQLSRAALCLAVFTAAPAAWGYVLPPPRPRPRLAAVAVDGEVDARDVRVEVRCREGGVVEHEARCDMTATFSLHARGVVTVSRGPDANSRARVGGVRLDAPRTMQPGETLGVVVTSTREISTNTRWRSAPWLLSAMITRHPLFGDGPEFERDDGGDGWVVIDGGALTVANAITVRSTTRRVRVAGAVTHGPRGDGHWGSRTRDEVTRLPQVSRVEAYLSIPVTPSATGILRRGGPVLGLGARWNLSGDDDAPTRFLVRAGYEFSLDGYVFVNGAVETDFDSLYESLTLEVASPSLALIIPSFHAGVGAVARQLGPRAADAGMRLRLGGGVLGVGADVDFDWYPAAGVWTLGAAARVSL